MPYIEPSVIEQAKKIDLLTYLQNREPGELVKLSSNTYTTKTHDSLKISNGMWYWWSRGFGGRSALDYLIKVRDMSFLDAVEHLEGCQKLSVLPALPIKQPEARAQSKLVLTPAAASNLHVKNYLELRGIDPRVVSHCLNKGILYESLHGTRPRAVFVGRDKNGAARYAAIRECSSDFKGEAKGSDKRFAFHLDASRPASCVHVFEGAIDALSYATLALKNDRDYRQMSLLTLGGIQPSGREGDTDRLPQALTQYLADNPQTRQVSLHLDNDEPGTKASNAIACALTGRGITVAIEPPPEGKDMNDYLLSRCKATAPEQIDLNMMRLMGQADAAKKASKANSERTR